MFSDGIVTATGHWRGWCFCEHPLVRVFLEPYRLGDSEDEGEHRLLVDRYLGTLEIGLARDVEQLLATQPSELHALTAHLSGRETRALLEQLPKQTHLRPHARGQHRPAVIRPTFYMPSSSTRMAATKYRRGPRRSCRTQQHVTKGGRVAIRDPATLAHRRRAFRGC